MNEHLSYRYRRRRNPQQHKEFCEAQRQRIEKRWEKSRDAQYDDPVRKSRVVELTIRDSLRPMRTIRLQCDPTERGWGRFSVDENGVMIGRRRFGCSAIAKLISASLM